MSQLKDTLTECLAAADTNAARRDASKTAAATQYLSASENGKPDVSAAVADARRLEAESREAVVTCCNRCVNLITATH